MMITIICFYLGIKKYIVGLIIKTSSEQQLLEKEKVYLGKLNMILVQVSQLKVLSGAPTLSGAN